MTIKAMILLGAIVFNACAAVTPANRGPQAEEHSEKVSRLGLELRESFKADGLPVPEISVQPGSGHATLSFGKISRDQFDRLTKAFSFPGIPAEYLPVYQAGRAYELLDFLPPKMQAFAGFRQTSTMEIDIPLWFPQYASGFLNGNWQEQIFLDTNCWGTAHDILVSDRFPTDAFLFTGDSRQTEYLTDAKRFEPVPKGKLAPYDWVAFYDMEEGRRLSISHLAIYLGHGLVFEKTGEAEFDHYRVSFLHLRHSASGEKEDYFRRPKDTKVASILELWSFANTKPRLPGGLERELADPAKRRFFNSLVLVPKGQGAGETFFLAPLVVKLTKDSQTGRYSFSPTDLPDFAPALGDREGAGL